MTALPTFSNRQDQYTFRSPVTRVVVANELRCYEGQADWQAEDFEDSGWIDVLTTAQKQELTDAARELPADESLWLKMTSEDLKLPTLSPHLAQVNREVEEGRGFALLRGIDLPPTDVDLAYRVNWILALALGDVIAQRNLPATNTSQTLQFSNA